MSKVDWSKAPEDATFYAKSCFRNNFGDWWCSWRGAGDWETSLCYSLEELLEANDYELRPKEIKVIDKPEVATSLQEEAARVATNGGTFVELVPADNRKPIKSDGGSSSYYDIQIPDWLFDKIYERRYSENCYIKTEELIEVMGDSFNQGTILKSLVRLNSLLNGVGKEGNSVDYECNKIIYYANRIKEENKR